MTEDEAKMKWCPFVGTPRFTHQSEECSGSACMAWRWLDAEYEDGTPLPVDTHPADPEWEKDGEPYWLASSSIPGGGGYRQRWRRPLPREGYCTLVSRPQRASPEK